MRYEQVDTTGTTIAAGVTLDGFTVKMKRRLHGRMYIHVVFYGHSTSLEKSSIPPHHCTPPLPSSRARFFNTPPYMYNMHMYM